MTTFLSNRAIYETITRYAVPAARERLWYNLQYGKQGDEQCR